MAGQPANPVTSLKPYLLRAVYDWAMENGSTPHIAVDATYAGVQVPERYVEGGRIVLNIQPNAIQGYQLTDEAISFSARFGGVAAEGGEPPPETPPPKKGPTLKIVK
jgi:stringent starvation protein B